jgi:hypothetical protein
MINIQTDMDAQGWRELDQSIQFPPTLANNTLNIEPLFATLGRDPMRAKRFGGAMNSLSNSEGYEVQYAIDNYEWAEIDERAGTVVDIGGSHGFVCVALAERFKKMKFVVQDLPRTVGSAPKLDGDVGRRVQFMAHDFYTTQPVKGADGEFCFYPQVFPGRLPEAEYTL